MKEATIVRRILENLKKLDQTFSFKEHGGPFSTAGIPDIICCHKGKFYGFEVKVPGGKASELQKLTIKHINEAGGVSEVVYSWEDVEKIIFGRRLHYEKRKKARKTEDLSEPRGEV